ENDRDARRRLVLKNRVIQEPVGVWNAATRCAARRVVRLRKVEVLVGERVEDVIGQRRRAWIGRALFWRVSRLSDVETRLILVQVLDVPDLLAAVHGNRRSQARVEELPLIVADDDDGLGGDGIELPA